MIELTPENIVALYKKHDKKPFRGRIFCRKDDSLCCPIGILYFDAHGRFAPCDSEDAKGSMDSLTDTLSIRCWSLAKPHVNWLSKSTDLSLTRSIP
jgi:hypothetical protein